jgi:hypothetical protein
MVVNIELEILEYSYWEHFKFLKDISLILPIEHPKRKTLEKEISEMLEKIHKHKTPKAAK